MRHLPDAPVVEDAGPDAAPLASVTVTAKVRCCDVAPGTPQAGVLVFVTQADGTPGETGTTDALGVATLANVRPGATVFAAYPAGEDGNRHVTVIAGVKPGDALTLGEDYYQPETSGLDGVVDLSWTAVDNATNYRVYSACASDGDYYSTGATTSVTLPVYAFCQVPTSPIVIVAVDVNANILASAYIPAATFTPGTALVAPAWTAQAATPAFAVGISGLPPTIVDVWVGSSASHGTLRTESRSAWLSLATGAGTANFSIPTTASSVLTSASLYRSGTQGRQFLYTRAASPVALTAPAVPWINGIAVSPGDGRAVWLQGPGTYDAAVVTFEWFRDEGKQYRQHDLTVILPPGVTELDLGTPPAALAPYLPTATEQVGSEVRLVDLSSVADYDAARALPEWRLVDPESAVGRGDEPSAAVSSYDAGEGFDFAP